MKSQGNKKLVYVAMSGGVDSSVAAALLSAEGGSASGGKKYDVVGVFMRPWQPGPVDNRHRKSVIHSDIRCLWQRDREDAMKVAAKLGIPLLTWDFSKEYKKEVTDYMLREYKVGRTPNPDVMCNKHIKFGLFLKKALAEGADYIATGHYVRIKEGGGWRVEGGKKLKKPHSTFYSLHTARDQNKDQSYFLWTLTQEQLKHCIFPIGDYTKPEVRRMAKKFGLPTADKKDSQGVCFVGPLDMKEFLKNYIKPKRGRIFDLNGNLIGVHDGIFYYTIGQRRGLDIKNGKGPYFVVSKDIKKNILIVAKDDNSSIFCDKETLLRDVNFITQKTYSQILQSSFDRLQSSPGVGDAPLREKHGQETTPRKNLGMIKGRVLVRTRYRQPLVRAKIVFTNVSKKSQRISAYKSASVRVLFEKSQKAITPGQSAVFYRNSELLGGGVIK